jgi:hypothetical protein
MRARSFSDDQDATAEDAKPEPEYVFDGFIVEFSVKIALTPPAAAKRGDVRQGKDAT